MADKLLLQTDGDTIRMNYYKESERDTWVKKVATGLLSSCLINRDTKVLFVGEGNFTFSVAFAALRKARLGITDPWEKIVSTCYVDKLLPNFHEVQMECIVSFGMIMPQTISKGK